jgi:hypothetical protein
MHVDNYKAARSEKEHMVAAVKVRLDDIAKSLEVKHGWKGLRYDPKNKEQMEELIATLT